jgi:hypothetical protein
LAYTGRNAESISKNPEVSKIFSVDFARAGIPNGEDEGVIYSPYLHQISQLKTGNPRHLVCIKAIRRLRRRDSKRSTALVCIPDHEKSKKENGEYGMMSIEWVEI